MVESLDAHIEHDACDWGVGERRWAAVILQLTQRRHLEVVVTRPRNC